MNFEDFKLTKQQMNQIKGGDAFSCKCDNGKTFTSAEPPSLEALVEAIESVCGGGGSSTRN